MRKLFFSFFFAFIFAVTCGQVQTGKASFYADKFEGTPTASGERYHHNRFTAAHKTLPFGTRLKVTNLENKESVKVTVTDRGPFSPGRVLDLSYSAADKLNILKAGVAPVRLKTIKRKKK